MKKILITLLLLSWAPAQAQTYVEVAPTFAIYNLQKLEGTQGVSVLITHRIDRRFEVGAIYTSRQQFEDPEWNCRNCASTVPSNYAVRAAVMLYDSSRWELGGGVAYWARTNEMFGQRQTFELTAGYKLTPRTVLRFRHYSNANQTIPNYGLNIVSVNIGL